jgi:hypothetical protein
VDVCDVCKQPFEAGVSCVWKAGSEVAREDLGSSGGFSGPDKVYRVTYAGLTEIPVAVCSRCLEKERRSGLPTSLGLLAVGVFFTVLPFSGLIGGDLRGICAPAAFFTFFLSLYALVDVVKHLRGSRSPGFIQDVTQPIVSAKALEIGLDKLFPPQ